MSTKGTYLAVLIFLLGPHLPAKATDFNADITNLCGKTWDGIRWHLGGQQNLTGEYHHMFSSGADHSSSFTAFPQPPALTGNVLWRTTGIWSIYSLDQVHIGVSVTATSILGCYLSWVYRDPNDPLQYLDDMTCFPAGVKCYIHTQGKRIEFLNERSRKIPHLYLGGARVEYYATHQPLKTLNAVTKRQPMATAKLDLPPAPLRPGQSVRVAYNPPPGATYVVFDFKVDKKPGFKGPQGVRIWAQFELTKPSQTRRTRPRRASRPDAGRRTNAAFASRQWASAG